MAIEHYENFPVASILIPKRQRLAIQTIYYFARTADDIADENLNIDIKIKQQQLNAFKKCLDIIKMHTKNATKNNTNIFENTKIHENSKKIFENLVEIMQKFDLNIQYFYDLLIAFQQDLVKNTYKNFSELKKYCSYSANPVGRLVLSLFAVNDNNAFHSSDCICSALQLINFCQDFFIDLKEKQRVYIPLDEIKNYNLTLNYLLNANANEILQNSAWQKLMLSQCQRAKNLMLEGKPLLKKLSKISWRLYLEIKFTICGGLFIIDKIIENLTINQQNLNIKNYRPKIRKTDYLTILAKSFFL